MLSIDILFISVSFLFSCTVISHFLSQTWLPLFLVNGYALRFSFNHSGRLFLIHGCIVSFWVSFWILLGACLGEHEASNKIIIMILILNPPYQGDQSRLWYLPSIEPNHYDHWSSLLPKRLDHDVHILVLLPR